jgi:hypothetical protein
MSQNNDLQDKTLQYYRSQQEGQTKLSCMDYCKTRGGSIDACTTICAHANDDKKETFKFMGIEMETKTTIASLIGLLALISLCLALYYYYKHQQGESAGSTAFYYF